MSQKFKTVRMSWSASRRWVQAGLPKLFQEFHKKIGSRNLRCQSQGSHFSITGA